MGGSEKSGLAGLDRWESISGHFPAASPAPTALAVVCKGQKSLRCRRNNATQLQFRRLSFSGGVEAAAAAAAAGERGRGRLGSRRKARALARSLTAGAKLCQKAVCIFAEEHHARGTHEATDRHVLSRAFYTTPARCVFTRAGA